MYIYVYMCLVYICWLKPQIVDISSTPASPMMSKASPMDSANTAKTTAGIPHDQQKNFVHMQHASTSMERHSK